MVTVFYFILDYNTEKGILKGELIMLEKIYNFKAAEEKIIEKLVDDENLVLNHMIFKKGDGLPEHFSNSNVYMMVIRGVLTLKLDEKEEHKYIKGSIVNIPYNVKMKVSNLDDEVLEIFVIKEPNPKNYGGK
jgi:quercetin dioxygenase-like cupin family protein